MALQIESVGGIDALQLLIPPLGSVAAEGKIISGEGRAWMAPPPYPFFSQTMLGTLKSLSVIGLMSPILRAVKQGALTYSERIAFAPATAVILSVAAVGVENARFGVVPAWGRLAKIIQRNSRHAHRIS